MGKKNRKPKSPPPEQREYGTYEIQPTADTDNAYPAIAQGLPKK